MTLLLITAISCLGMVGADVCGVYLNVAENRGRAGLAGLMDMGLDGWGKLVLTAFGFDRLTRMGVGGWLCCIPVLATGGLTTWRATKRAQGMAAAPEQQTGNRRAPSR